MLETNDSRITHKFLVSIGIVASENDLDAALKNGNETPLVRMCSRGFSIVKTVRTLGEISFSRQLDRDTCVLFFSVSIARTQPVYEMIVLRFVVETDASVPVRNHRTTAMKLRERTIVRTVRVG
jgi:hypothetical protein